MEGARPYTDLEPVPHSVSWETGRAESPLALATMQLCVTAQPSVTASW